LEQIADPASTSSQSSEFIAAMSNNLTQFFGAFVADALQLCGVGLSNFGGTVAGHALQQLIRKRLDDARDIVLEEIQRGDRLPIEPADGDEVVAIVFNTSPPRVKEPHAETSGLWRASCAGKQPLR
jgi:hypothetical protein